jgi:hypothetical protein
MENGRCRLHGGMSLRGMAHPNYQGKGYSRYVPKPLEPAITAFLESGDPLDLIQPIATWEGRIDQLLHALEDEGDSGVAWSELAKEWAGFWAATAAEDAGKVRIHREAIDTLLKSGLAEVETWKQIREADETRRKLIDSEDKKRERRRGWMRAEEIRYQNNALRLAVVEAMALIEDPKLQRKVRTFIAERFIQVVGPAALPGPAASAGKD